MNFSLSASTDPCFSARQSGLGEEDRTAQDRVKSQATTHTRVPQAPGQVKHSAVLNGSREACSHSAKYVLTAHNEEFSTSSLTSPLLYVRK